MVAVYTHPFCDIGTTKHTLENNQDLRLVHVSSALALPRIHLWLTCEEFHAAVKLDITICDSLFRQLEYEPLWEVILEHPKPQTPCLFDDNFVVKILDRKFPQPPLKST